MVINLNYSVIYSNQLLLGQPKNPFEKTALWPCLRLTADYSVELEITLFLQLYHQNQRCWRILQTFSQDIRFLAIVSPYTILPAFYFQKVVYSKHFMKFTLSEFDHMTGYTMYTLPLYICGAFPQIYFSPRSLRWDFYLPLDVRAAVKEKNPLIYIRHYIL